MILNTIALLVLFAAVFVLFTAELQSFARKIISNNTCRFIFPLLFMSLLVLIFEEQVTYLLILIRISLYSVIYHLAKIIPFNTGQADFEKVLLLVVISFFPLLLARLLSENNFFQKYKITQYVTHVSAILWLICGLLLVMVL